MRLVLSNNLFLSTDSGKLIDLIMSNLTIFEHLNYLASQILQIKIHNASLISDKMGVAIFRYFAADRQFGTYAILFLGVKFH